MASVIVPNVDAPIAGPGGQTTRAWYAYFQSLRVAASGNATLQAAIDAILIRLESLENEAPVDFSIIGPQSVVVTGIPGNGFVQLTLAGDENSPGPTYYYGTDSTGEKGFFSVASAFAAGDGVTLTTDEDTGVTTIEATAGTGGVLPVVTGEVPPVLLYADDGSLIYAPASY